jgi:hypothetical protein
MGKRIGVGMLTIGATLGLWAGLAQGGIATGIEVDGAGYSGSSLENTWIVGHLTSSNPKCIPNRKVKVSFQYIGETEKRLVDTARTSKSGEFAGLGPTTHGAEMNGVDRFIIQAASKKIGTKQHPKVCASDQEEFTL